MRRNAPVRTAKTAAKKRDPQLPGHGTSPGGGCSPIDIAARREAFVIELAGVLEIADAAHAGFDLDELSVAQVGRRLVVAQSNADAGPGFRRKLENELVTLFGKGRRRNYAAIQDNRFARSRLDFRRASRTVQYGEERAAKKKDQ